MIQLDGLTARQVEIADRLWNYETQDELIEYIDTLLPKDQFDARSLVICMLQAAIEEEHDGSISQAANELDKIMKKL